MEEGNWRRDPPRPSNIESQTQRSFAKLKNCNFFIWKGRKFTAENLNVECFMHENTYGLFTKPYPVYVLKCSICTYHVYEVGIHAAVLSTRIYYTTRVVNLELHLAKLSLSPLRTIVPSIYTHVELTCTPHYSTLGCSYNHDFVSLDRFCCCACLPAWVDRQNQWKGLPLQESLADWQRPIYGWSLISQSAVQTYSTTFIWLLMLFSLHQPWQCDCISSSIECQCYFLFTLLQGHQRTECST